MDFLSLKELVDRATAEIFHPKHLTEYLSKLLTDSFKENFGNSSAISADDGVSFRLFQLCTLIKHAV